MLKNVLLPQVELTMENVTVLEWLVQVGDHVSADQPLMEVETQKATLEVPSPEAGYVRQLCVQAGDQIGKEALICVLSDTADESLEVESSDESTESKASVSVDEGLQETAKPETSLSGAPERSETNAPSDGPILAAPAARKLAKDRGIDLTGVKGSGPGGRITVADVESLTSATNQNTSNAAEWTSLPTSRIALNAQMTKSLAEIPQIQISRQMDVTSLSRKVADITFTHRLIAATSQALEKHPALRTVIEGERVKTEPVSVAIAMDTPRGLLAPVLREANGLAVEQIAVTVRDFHTRANSGTLRREEMINGPFAITNLGMFGVDLFSPFVFYGQTAVLAIGRSTDSSGSRKVAWFTLAVDHRVVDGAEAARFLETLQQIILAM
jgi:pyruvate dehydrogenase E2 component (dihydrolipoamide acetyltransferase)